MSEPTEAKEPAPLTGWTKLYHRSGALVTIPVTAAPLDYAAMLANVNAMIAAGFAVTAPGLEAGEIKEQVGFIVRGQRDDGREITDFLLLYSPDDGKKFSYLKVWLNKDEDVAAFEAASGMKLESIPVYVGQDKPERGKNRVVDNQFMRQVPKPFPVILQENPKWKQSEADAAAAEKKMYTVPRRVFLRWADAPASSSPKDGDCITEKEAANLAEIIMKIRQTTPVFVSKFIMWLGGVTKTPATLDDLQTIPKAKYAQGLQHLQKLEMDFDRAGAK